MNAKRVFTGMARGAALLSAGIAATYLAYIATTWLRYGRRSSERSDSARSPIDQFMPCPEVCELHESYTLAPADITFQALCETDLQRAPLIRAIFSLRNLPARLRGAPDVTLHRGLLAETRQLGWGTLEEKPKRLVVMGAVTQPWVAAPVFRAIPPTEFAAFNEPGYAKIIWTLEAEPRGAHASIARTETRVQTTDPVSRERFRRYWSLLSPGILIIRIVALALAKSDAEQRARIEESAIAGDQPRSWIATEAETDRAASPVR